MHPIHLNLVNRSVNRRAALCPAATEDTSTPLVVVVLVPVIRSGPVVKSTCATAWIPNAKLTAARVLVKVN